MGSLKSHWIFPCFVPRKLRRSFSISSPPFSIFFKNSRAESSHHRKRKKKKSTGESRAITGLQLKNMRLSPFLPSDPQDSGSAKMSSPVQITTGVDRPSATSPPTLDIVRCSRCQQSLSLGQPGCGAVQFGMNSYYCSRCATKVGFGR